ncbi:MAG: phospho-N-acetylmuramoyl-pentapeptide-transferase [Candidatus Paceibacterota bacterium]
MDILKIFIPTTITFIIGILITPILSAFLYKHKMWKKKSVAVTTDGIPATLSQKLHNDEEKKTPRMGGIVIWASALITVLLFWFGSIIDGPVLDKFNFLSRNQTWLPLFTLIVGALIGLIDDYFSVTERYDQKAGGLSAKKRLLLVFIISLIGAWWFYTKLEMTEIIIPFVGTWDAGLLFILFFVLVMLGTYSGGVIDGLDGLAGGVLAIIFGAYGLIALIQNQIDLATFCFVLVGGLLAFLWFNIPPARFYMSETGIMALTITLVVIAFLTKQVLILPIIAFPLVISSASSTIQLLSKKFRNGKKVFLVAPIHHHFQALGWPATKVVMRYWVITMIFASLGIIISLIG